MKARLLLSITKYLRLGDRPYQAISIQEIEKAASQQANHNWPLSKSPHAKVSRDYFVAQATGWLTFLNRLQIAPKTQCTYRNDVRAYGGMLLIG